MASWIPPGTRPDRIVAAIVLCFVVGGTAAAVLAVSWVVAGTASALASLAVIVDALFRKPPTDRRDES